MRPFEVVGLTALAVGVFLLLEVRRARGNERHQRAKGGIEPQGDVHAIMTVVYPACFAVMMIEGWTRALPVPGALLALGASIFALAKALKWWAIVTLGPCWTFRVIVVPGGRRIVAGPYAWLRHPNYVAVAGELGGVALLTGARWTGPIALVVFAALMWRRMVVENAALRALSGPDAILRRG
jgi:methyltransferase